jgi:hypothetical protein
MIITTAMVIFALVTLPRLRVDSGLIIGQVYMNANATCVHKQRNFDELGLGSLICVRTFVIFHRPSKKGIIYFSMKISQKINKNLQNRSWMRWEAHAAQQGAASLAWAAGNEVAPHRRSHAACCVQVGCGATKGGTASKARPPKVGSAARCV